MRKNSLGTDLPPGLPLVAIHRPLMVERTLYAIGRGALLVNSLPLLTRLGIAISSSSFAGTIAANLA